MEETQEERIQQFKDNPVLYTEQWRHLIDWVEARGGEWMITEEAKFAFIIKFKSESEANIFEAALKLSCVKVIRESDTTEDASHEN